MIILVLLFATCSSVVCVDDPLPVVPLSNYNGYYIGQGLIGSEDYGLGCVINQYSNAILIAGTICNKTGWCIEGFESKNSGSFLNNVKPGGSKPILDSGNFDQCSIYDSNKKCTYKGITGKDTFMVGNMQVDKQDVTVVTEANIWPTDDFNCVLGLAYTTVCSKPTIQRQNILENLLNQQVTDRIIYSLDIYQVDLFNHLPCEDGNLYPYIAEVYAGKKIPKQYHFSFILVNSFLNT